MNRSQETRGCSASNKYYKRAHTCTPQLMRHTTQRRYRLFFFAALARPQDIQKFYNTVIEELPSNVADLI